MPRERQIFLSVAAQPDNLGDIEIRQIAVEMAASAQTPLVVFAGQMPESYLAALELPSRARVVRSAPRFVFAFATAALRRRAHLMLAPGPYVLPRRLTGHAKAVGVLVVAWFISATGGAVVSPGRAFRGSGHLGARVQLALARRCAVFWTRDLVSSAALGSNVRDGPDLALLHEQVPATEKTTAVLSFRGDRAVVPDLVGALVFGLRAAGLTPVLCTQVRRDDVQHLELGEQFGIEVVEWGARDHVEQWRRVREVYARADYVISDRLHAVIFGLQSGALPVVVLRTDPDKVVATVGHHVPLQCVDPDVPATWSGVDFAASPQDRSALDAAVGRARDSVAALRAEVRRAFMDSRQ